MKDTAPEIIEDVTMLMPREPWPWYVWAAAAVVAVAAVTGFFLLRRRIRANALETKKPSTPPEISARERLSAIRHLITEEKHEQFVIEVSAILRDYVEARFGLKAPTLASEEFLYEAERSALLDERWRGDLGVFLARCDRVKFALAHMQPPKMELLYTTVANFIDDTAAAGATAVKAEPVQVAPPAPANPEPSAPQ